ncbi:MAG: DUF4465 domain-containing protein [Crocinitomicaceae bacterium]|nr:DUF4465 domain-containing protein [Crocinitomicaceae bacterium]
MKKIYVLTTTLLLGLGAAAQDVIDFESQVLTVDSYDNGSAGAGEFIFTAVGNDVAFGNYYDPAGWWNGFSISNVTDDTTAGWLNQYSAYTGIGNNASENYAIFYPGGSITGSAAPQIIDSIKITNTTFAAISMRDGDDYGKQFGSPNDANGDPDGTNGEDFFKVWIICQDFAGNESDSVEFFLADYRFADNTQDYIIDAWTNIDLTGFSFTVSKIDFRFESSDMNMAGPWINTPTYLALDDLAFASVVNVGEKVLTDVTTYPNPAESVVNIKGQTGELMITSLTGAVVFNANHNGMTSINVSDFASGIYAITLSNASGIYTEKLVIK